jgi:formylglycine-generating enzyme required for sulfatase activity
MKRRSVFVVFAAIGMACSMSAISCIWAFNSKEAGRRQDETAKALGVPKETDLNLGNKVTMKLVLIPSGKFMMGSPKDEKGRKDDEGPQHEVTISKPFYMGIYPVTQEQYQQVMGKNPSDFEGASDPVEQVSWNDAVAFCKTLTKKTGKVVLLPTEAQWEWACRAGTTTPFNTGNTISTDEANYDGNSVYGDGKKGGYHARTIPVGSFKPNAFGLYDMHGNVWQWCSDWYDKDYYSANRNGRDSQGPKEGLCRVLRGGGWYNPPVYCRSASRDWTVPAEHNSLIGFRVAVLPDDK